MAALFQEAELKGLWFWCQYQDLWFHPEDLKRAQSEGRFRWGPENWKLRPPEDHANELKQEAEAAQRRYEAFRSEMSRVR